MNIDEQVRNKRAIEALRNGVPNRDAVTELVLPLTHIDGDILTVNGVVA